MSKENTRKCFGQLLSSPSVSWRGRFKRKQPLRLREKTVNKQQGLSKYGSHVEDFKIDDASDDETVGPSISNGNERLHASHPSSMPPSINPAEVTIDRRNVSGSEIESLSEGETLEQSAPSSDASGSDDCTAIHCRKTKMTPLSFVDKRNFKRRRITDDMDVTFSTSVAAKMKPVPKDLFNLKSFKPIGAKRTALDSSSGQIGDVASSTTPSGSAAKSRWKDLDKSFSEQTFDFIEDLPPSPEDDSIHCQSDSLAIEELPSSAEDASNDRAADKAASSTTFYVPSPQNKGRLIKYPKVSALASLANVLREKDSKRNFWQHELQSGLIHPVTVVRIESIERSFGRVLLRFFSAPENGDGDAGVQQMENIIYLDASDNQLRTIRAGMDVAFEADERIPPHRISLKTQVHLGVAKISPIQSISK
uniref:Uncharacterized protein n=1 Tax=Anopheles atroparvus TaxID=41427 RepID=A0AAG5CT49_ANOAO